MPLKGAFARRSADYTHPRREGLATLAAEARGARRAITGGCRQRTIAYRESAGDGH